MTRQDVHGTSQIDEDGRKVSVLLPHEQADPAAERHAAPISDRVQALRFEKSRYQVKRPRRRRWLWLALLAILVGGGFYVGKETLSEMLVERQVSGVTATCERPLDVALDTNGYIIAHSLVKVGARVPGLIVELSVEEGQRVKKDQVIARLDDGQFAADLAQAKATLAVAVAQLAECRAGARPEDVNKARAALAEAEAQEQQMAKEAERANRLRNTISPSEYDRVTSGYDRSKAAAEQARQALRLVELGPRKERIAAAEAEVENAKAVVAKAQFFYDGTRVVSPIDGTVLRRSMELGEMIRLESLADSLCTIADLDALEAEIDIQERDLKEIRLGQRCLITTEAYPDHEYQGQLAWLAPVYNRQRGVRRAKAKILQGDELLAPDMNCRVQILRADQSAPAASLVHVPEEAVFEEDQQKFAFVLEGDVARRRAVQVGATRDAKVEVCDGIRDGEVVLLAGNQPLRDGQKVRAHVKHVKEKAK
jgi:RND family efflux transporter MFP subunit